LVFILFWFLFYCWGPSSLVDTQITVCAKLKFLLSVVVALNSTGIHSFNLTCIMAINKKMFWEWQLVKELIVSCWKWFWFFDMVYLTLVYTHYVYVLCLRKKMYQFVFLYNYRISWWVFIIFVPLQTGMNTLEFLKIWWLNRLIDYLIHRWHHSGDTLNITKITC